MRLPVMALDDVLADERGEAAVSLNEQAIRGRVEAFKAELGALVAITHAVDQESNPERTGFSDHGCGCDPRQRCFQGADWEKKPARLDYVCLSCGGVGVLFVQHQPGRIDASLILRGAIDGIHDRADRRSRTGLFYFSISGHDLRYAFARAIDNKLLPLVRLLGRVERYELSVRVFQGEAKAAKSKYQRLYLQVLAWVADKMPAPVAGTAVASEQPYGSVAIYTLADPREPEFVRYVGQSVNPAGRLRQHISSTPWAKELAAIGVIPEMRIIEWLPNVGLATVREAQWIDLYRGRGMADQNIHVPNFGVAV